MNNVEGKRKLYRIWVYLWIEYKENGSVPPHIQESIGIIATEWINWDKKFLDRME